MVNLLSKRYIHHISAAVVLALGVNLSAQGQSGHQADPTHFSEERPPGSQKLESLAQCYTGVSLLYSDGYYGHQGVYVGQVERAWKGQLESEELEAFHARWVVWVGNYWWDAAKKVDKDMHFETLMACTNAVSE